MPFDASKVDELLDYTLTDPEEKGRVPEPTAAEARKFRDEINVRLYEALGVTADEAETLDVDAWNEHVRKLTRAQRDDLSAMTLESIIELCKGSPSRDQITRMGGLKQLHFTSWLLDVLSPLF